MQGGQMQGGQRMQGGQWRERTRLERACGLASMTSREGWRRWGLAGAAGGRGCARGSVGASLPSLRVTCSLCTVSSTCIAVQLQALASAAKRVSAHTVHLRTNFSAWPTNGCERTCMHDLSPWSLPAWGGMHTPTRRGGMHTPTRRGGMHTLTRRGLSQAPSCKLDAALVCVEYPSSGAGVSDIEGVVFDPQQVYRGYSRFRAHNLRTLARF